MCVYVYAKVHLLTQNDHRKWTSGSDNVALSLECFDCRTWGTVLADFKTDTDSANISLTFHGFGAYFSLGASLAAQGTYSRALGYFRNPPHNVGSPISLYISSRRTPTTRSQPLFADWQPILG